VKISFISTAIAATLFCLPCTAKFYNYYRYTDTKNKQRFALYESDIFNQKSEVEPLVENAPNCVDMIFALMPISHEKQGELFTHETEPKIQVAKGTNIAETIAEGIRDKQIVVTNGGLFKKFLRFAKISKMLENTETAELFFAAAAELFMDSDWHAYSAQNGKICVLIYKPTYFEEPDQLDLERIGLNSKKIHKIEEVNKKNPDLLFNNFQFETNREIDIKALNSIWSPTQDAKKIKVRAVVHGHGWPPKETKEKQLDQIEKTKKEKQDLEKNLKETEKEFLADQELDETEEEDLRALEQEISSQAIELAQQKKQLYKERVNSFTGASVTGLPTENFLLFFDKLKQRNCQMLFLLNCFTRGVNELLLDDEVPFVIATDNFPDAESWDKGKKHFSFFFTAFHLFMKEVKKTGGWKNWTQQNKKTIKQQFKKIFREIITEEDNLLSIRLPGKNAFLSIPLSDTLEIISYPKLEKLKQKKRDILEIENEIKKVALEADIIEPPITTHPDVQFIPMIFGPSHYFIEKLTILSPYNQNNFEKIFKMFTSRIAFMKLFFIKDLYIENHSPIFYRKKLAKDFSFPFSITGTKTLHLKNVTFFIEIDLEKNKIDADIAFQYNRSYFINPIESLDFEKIDQKTAKNTILNWVKQTQPFELAVEKTTGTQTEAEFLAKISDALKKK